MSDNQKKKEKRINKITNEFKEFISRGSVMDLAVGIIVGSSFTAIVTSLVADVLTPLMSLFIGGIDFSSLVITLPAIFTDEPAILSYGKFIQAVINFFVVAICVFFIIKVMNTLRKKMEQEVNKKKEEGKKEEEKKDAEPPKPDPQILLLEEIRDLLKGEK